MVASAAFSLYWETRLVTAWAVQAGDQPVRSRCSICIYGQEESVTDGVVWMPA